MWICLNQEHKNTDGSCTFYPVGAIEFPCISDIMDRNEHIEHNTKSRTYSHCWKESLFKAHRFSVNESGWGLMPFHDPPHRKWRVWAPTQVFWVHRKEACSMKIWALLIGAELKGKHQVFPKLPWLTFIWIHKTQMTFYPSEHLNVVWPMRYRSHK